MLNLDSVVAAVCGVVLGVAGVSFSPNSDGELSVETRVTALEQWRVASVLNDANSRLERATWRADLTVARAMAEGWGLERVTVELQGASLALVTDYFRTVEDLAALPPIGIDGMGEDGQPLALDDFSARVLDPWEGSLVAAVSGAYQSNEQMELRNLYRDRRESAKSRPSVHRNIPSWNSLRKKAGR